jgi:uncharacterized protein involved in cysteine biosynthesis
MKGRTEKKILLFLANIILLVIVWTSIFSVIEEYINVLAKNLGEWVRYLVFGVASLLLTLLNYNTFGDWCVAYA